MPDESNLQLNYLVYSLGPGSKAIVCSSWGLCYIYGHQWRKASVKNIDFPGVTGAGGRVLPYKRLMGLCRWMGSHFHHWIDYNGVAFSIELLE